MNSLDKIGVTLDGGGAEARLVRWSRWHFSPSTIPISAMFVGLT